MTQCIINHASIRGYPTRQLTLYKWWGVPPDGLPVHYFDTLLGDLATLTSTA